MVRLRLHYVAAVLLFVAIGSADSREPPGATEPLSPEEITDLGYRVASTPSRDLPGYRKLRNMLVMNASPQLEAALKSVAPEVEFTFSRSSSTADIPKVAYDAVAGSTSAVEHVAVADSPVWVHTYSAGVDRVVSIEWVRDRKPIVTNSSGTAAAAIAEHAIALMMVHARQLHHYRDNQQQARWDRGTTPQETWLLGDRTVLVLGLGAIGSQIAERAHALGMRVVAVRNSSRDGPDYVDYVGLSHEMRALAAEADVVINALPLTPDTGGIIDREFFAVMKPTAIIVNIGRGGTIVTEDLMDAIESGKIAGAGLDVTDPEPLPRDHPLWAMPEVVITPHIASRGSTSAVRSRLLVDNVRRYQAGEPLLNLVSIEEGY